MFNHKIFDTYCASHTENLVSDICLEPECQKRLICESCRPIHNQTHHKIKPIIQLSKINLRKDFQIIKELHLKEFEVLDNIIERIRQSFEENLQFTKEKIFSIMPKQNLTKKDWDFIMNELETLYNEYFIINVDFRDHENFDLLDIFTGKYANYLTFKSHLESLIETRKRDFNVRSEAIEAFDTSIKKVLYHLRRPITREDLEADVNDQDPSKLFLGKHVSTQTKIELVETGISTDYFLSNEIGTLTDATIMKSRDTQTLESLMVSKDVQTNEKMLENRDMQTINKEYEDVQIQTELEKAIVKINRMLQTDEEEKQEAIAQTEVLELNDQNLQTSFENEKKEFEDSEAQVENLIQISIQASQTDDVIIRPKLEVISKNVQTEEEHVKKIEKMFSNRNSQTDEVDIRAKVKLMNYSQQTEDFVKPKIETEKLFKSSQTEISVGIIGTQTEVNSTSKSVQIVPESIQKSIQTDNLKSTPKADQETLTEKVIIRTEKEESLNEERLNQEKMIPKIQVKTEVKQIQAYIEDPQFSMLKSENQSLKQHMQAWESKSKLDKSFQTDILDREKIEIPKKEDKIENSEPKNAAESQLKSFSTREVQTTAEEKKLLVEKLLQTDEKLVFSREIQVSALILNKSIQTDQEAKQEEEKDPALSKSSKLKGSRKLTDVTEFSANNIIIERYLDITAACTAHSMRFIDGQDVLIVGDKNGSITIWEGENYQKVFSANPHSKAITNLKYSPANNFVITSSEDCSIKVWELVDNCLKFKASFIGDSKSVMGILIIDPLERFYACGSGDPEIKGFDLANLKPSTNISTNKKNDMGAQMVYIKHMNALAVGFNAGSIGIYSLLEFKEIVVIKTYFGECNMNSMIYLEKSNLLLARVANKTIASWRLDGEKVAHIREFTVGNNKPNIEIINEGKLLLVTTLEAVIYTIDPGNGTVTASNNIGLKHCNGMTYDSIRKKLFIGDGRYPKVAIINY